MNLINIQIKNNFKKKTSKVILAGSQNPKLLGPQKKEKHR